MELRHLRYFVVIAEERSFTRAAERLWVAQPGLSAQIRRLEAELGIRLFERHTRGVDLTQAGAVFLERARAALVAADAAGATGRDLEAGLIGGIRLGVAGEARSRLSADLLQRMTRERPGIELTVLEGYGGTLWRDLRDGRLDALVAPTGHGSPDLRSLELGLEEWVVLVGTRHPLAGIGPLTSADLHGQQIVVTGHRDGAVYDKAVARLLDELGAAPELVPGLPGPAPHAAVAGNQVIALTTWPGPGLPGVVPRKLDPRRALGFELLWRGETPSPALAELIHLASAYAQSSPASRSLAAVA